MHGCARFSTMRRRQIDFLYHNSVLCEFDPGLSMGLSRQKLFFAAFYFHYVLVFSENEPHNLPFRKIFSLLVRRTALKVQDFNFRVVGKGPFWAHLGPVLRQIVC